MAFKFLHAADILDIVVIRMPALIAAPQVPVLSIAYRGGGAGDGREGRRVHRIMVIGPCPARVAMPLMLECADGDRVSALMLTPDDPAACYVMAHGAGAGMTHPFMDAVAHRLARRGFATLRFQFPFMERGSRRPDRPEVARGTVRTAVAASARLLPGLPLLAGGKSFGGRMTSQAQAEAALPGVVGLAFFGFPLHPAGKPSVSRAAHLAGVGVPMLFLHGARDALAWPGMLGPVVTELGARATLWTDPDADHAFHAPARSGRTDAQVLDGAIEAFARWAELLWAEPLVAAPAGLGRRDAR